VNDTLIVLLTLLESQGARLQMLLAVEETPTNGTLIPSVGMANVWPTPLPLLES